MAVRHAKREAALAILCLIVTLTLYALLFDRSIHKVYDSYFFPNLGPFYGGLLFLVALFLVLYAALLYNVCLIGNYMRQMRERVPDAQLCEAWSQYDRQAESLVALDNPELAGKANALHARTRKVMTATTCAAPAVVGAQNP